MASRYTNCPISALAYDIVHTEYISLEGTSGSLRKWQVSSKWISQIWIPELKFKDYCVLILLWRKQYEILKLTWTEPILMELNNILHRQMIPLQLVTSFRSTSTDVEQNIKGWATCECNRTKYMRIVRTDPPLWLNKNAEFRKRIEESSMQPISGYSLQHYIYVRH
jgi:hypothetical protein